MYNFFTNNLITGDRYEICGEDFNHIKNVLRLKVGDDIIISNNGISNLCRIESFSSQSVIAVTIQENFIDTNLPVKIYLFQGMPKSDKLEFVIQKAVELGVEKIIPVETARSIVKIDKKKMESKLVRWQAIAESAAKQSKRVSIPEVESVLTVKQALEKIKELDLTLVPYENKDGMKATKEALSRIKSGMKIGVFIGPEGGFEEEEIALLESVGALTISLGKRILRTETAAISSISMIMLYSEMVL